MDKPYKEYASKEELEADYANFKDDWEVNVEEQSAQHKSGVKLYVMGTYEENGKPHLKIHRKIILSPEMPDLGMEEMKKFLKYLNAQFRVIYAHMEKREFKDPRNRTPEERRKIGIELDKQRIEMYREMGVPEDTLKKLEQQYAQLHKQKDYY